MGFEAQRKELIATAEKLLSEGAVDVILGFCEGDEGGKTTPLFLRKSSEAQKLLWDESCSTKLAKYLLEKKGKVGIVAKPCDARAIVMYLTEKQIARENVFIIGMECAGMKNEDGTCAPGCESCKVRIPPLYDVLISFGEAIEPACAGKVQELSAEDRQKRFKAELSKCILCYSCRQACYGCYCTTCFMDRTVPNFLPGELDEGAKMTYHLGRAMHLASRCVECGECERVCPSGVHIRYLIEELNGFCKEEYGYESGMDADATPALAVFSSDDREVGFLGGEG